MCWIKNCFIESRRIPRRLVLYGIGFHRGMVRMRDRICKPNGTGEGPASECAASQLMMALGLHITCTLHTACYGATGTSFLSTQSKLHPQPTYVYEDVIRTNYCRAPSCQRSHGRRSRGTNEFFSIQGTVADALTCQTTNSLGRMGPRTD
jgi:hypothetical protein